MVNIVVRVVERVKREGKWAEVTVKPPKLSKAGNLFLKDDRQGNFLTGLST
jgi:hypothetical protein